MERWSIHLRMYFAPEMRAAEHPWTRVQIHRQFRKPLVIISPKNLLRLPQAKSPLAEFDEIPDDKGIVGVRFKRVIMDESATDRCMLRHKSRAVSAFVSFL